MAEFLDLQSSKDAISTLLKNLGEIQLKISTIPSLEGMDRIIAKDIQSPNSLPDFQRSTVDGYAVSASDTYGASDNLPAYLTIIGEANMGATDDLDILPGQAVIIHTGGMLPKNSDAVMMIEDTQRVSNSEVEIFKGIAIGENVLGIGEDVEYGQVVLKAGTRIRPVEIGGLMALGIMNIPVWDRPRVGIISSGDEIIDPRQDLRLGQVRDINSYMLSAQVASIGGEPVLYGTVPDNLNDLLVVAKKAYKECDMVVFTAGSSISVRDITSKAIGLLGEPGVLVHGVKIKPGKPVILAVCSGKPVIGLPGNPVSAFVAANLFVTPVIKSFLKMDKRNITPIIRAELATNIPSKAGREDWVPVRLEELDKGWRAIPIFSKSNYIFSLVAADGMICIPSDQTGMDAGNFVDVVIY
jgi:molybdopterin molybdotransferase